MPPTYFLVLLLLSIGLHLAIPVKEIIPTPYNYLGIVFIIFGVIINIWTDNLFTNSQTTVKPFKKPSLLIKSGPFFISRNPMYLGMVSILLGIAILLKSLTTFISPIIYIVIMEILFILKEEKSLEKTFGNKYLNYKKKVRRWI